MKYGKDHKNIYAKFLVDTYLWNKAQFSLTNLIMELTNQSILSATSNLTDQERCCMKKFTFINPLKKKISKTKKFVIL